jgi:hypothetical protein
MQILILVDAFWPDHTSGISKSLLPVVEGLSDMDHRVTVVSRRHKATDPTCERKEGKKGRI